MLIDVGSRAQSDRSLQPETPQLETLVRGEDAAPVKQLRLKSFLLSSGMSEEKQAIIQYFAKRESKVSMGADAWAAYAQEVLQRSA